MDYYSMYVNKLCNFVLLQDEGTKTAGEPTPMDKGTSTAAEPTPKAVWTIIPFILQDEGTKTAGEPTPMDKGTSTAGEPTPKALAPGAQPQEGPMVAPTSAEGKLDDAHRFRFVVPMIVMADINGKIYRLTTHYSIAITTCTSEHGTFTEHEPIDTARQKTTQSA
ncbi:hypothetical protein Q1695_010827 [Nippostrongylus brasiliensis]|nr:hypothetical protein Q1695_010827 [Nippostrongylus brasiliensis]